MARTGGELHGDGGAVLPLDMVDEAGSGGSRLGQSGSTRLHHVASTSVATAMLFKVVDVDDPG
jgi:hypothetical protein